MTAWWFSLPMGVRACLFLLAVSQVGVLVCLVRIAVISRRLRDIHDEMRGAVRKR